MKVTVLTESELRRVVKVDRQAVEAIEQAFTWLAEGRVDMPPIMHITVPDYQGDVDIKSAYVSGLDRFAVKIGAGFFQNYKSGEITAGRKPGRQTDAQITICDLSGTGVQDTAIANLAVEQALGKGFGTQIKTGNRP